MSRSEGYSSNLVHELTHWSGAKHRLNRDFGKRFGYQAYAAEELVFLTGILAVLLAGLYHPRQTAWRP